MIFSRNSGKSKVPSIVDSFSVLIPFFRKEYALKALFYSLLRERQWLHEVIIFCDGCPVPDFNPAPELFRFIGSPDNKGLVNARNQLIEAAKGDALLFLDADCILIRNSLQKLSEKWDQSSFFGGQEFSSPRKTCTDKFRHYFWRQTLGEKPLDNADFFMGLCCGGLKENFRKLQGFNPLFHNYGEDLEFSFHAFNKGYKIMYIPELRVFHFRNDNLKSLHSMIKNHSKGQINAFLVFKRKTRPLFINNLHWIYKSTGSALIKKRSVSLALLAFFSTIFALLCKIWYFLTFKEKNYARRN
jgi:GT2 family glycosyltransferase